MKALKIIVIVIVALLIVASVISFFLPKHVKVEVSRDFNSPAALIFDQVNDFDSWHLWSPFDDADTTMVTDIGGSMVGEGAIMEWKGKKDHGSMKIVESRYPEYIKTELLFDEESPATSEWFFEGEGNQTMVTWTLETDFDGCPMNRYQGLIFPVIMKKFYEKGLEDLDKLCINLPYIEGLEIIPLEKQYFISVLDSTPVRNIGKKMGEMYGELGAYMAKNNIDIAGYPFATYYEWNYAKPFVFECAIPVDKEYDPEGRVHSAFMTEGIALRAPHYGSYERTGDLHGSIMKYLEVKGIKHKSYPWEEYVTDPQSEPDTSKWLTNLYYRLR